MSLSEKRLASRPWAANSRTAQCLRREDERILKRRTLFGAWASATRVREDWFESDMLTFFVSR